MHGPAIDSSPGLPFVGRPFYSRAPMSRVPWPLIQDRQPRAHLVVGVVAQSEGPAEGDQLNAARNLLIRLVKQQKPGGDFAATVVRDTGRPEVYFAFDDEADAQKFGDAVEAETTDTYPGWASQRAFELLGAKLASLEASLPAPRDQPRQRGADVPRSGRRLRGGLRVPIRRYDER